MSDTKSSRYIVTGASRRLGLFLVLSLLEAGKVVMAITRSNNKCFDDLKDKYGNKLIVVQVSDYDENSAQRLKSRVFDFKADCLINNASIYELDKPVEDSIEQYKKFFNVHMLFPAYLSDCFYSSISGQCKGVDRIIINITDIFSSNPDCKSSLYCSTKAGLENLTISMAKKYSPFVRVNSIQPGPMKFLPEHDEHKKKEVLDQALIKREGGFLSIYKAVVYIADNDYVTGTSIKVDGGRSISNI